MTDEKRPLPHDEVAELSVLGSLIIDPTAVGDVADILRVDDFFFAKHRDIYAACIALQGQNYDYLMVLDHMRRHGSFWNHDDDMWAAAPPYIAELLNYVPTSVNARHYARIVLDRSLRRQTLQALGQTAKETWDLNLDIDAVVGQGQGRLIDVTAHNGGDNRIDLAYHMDSLFDKVRRRHNGEIVDEGVGLPYPDLSFLLGSFEPGRLYIFAGRPGMGKSAWLAGLAQHAATRENKAAAMFVMEMTGEQLATRMVSSVTGIPSTALKRGQLDGEQWAKYIDAHNAMRDMRLFIDDTPSLTPSQLLSKCRRIQVLHGLDIVFVDYLQLMTADRVHQNKVHEIGEISARLKIMSKELGVPVVAAAQLSRAVEMRNNKRPLLSDLRDSGNIEQDADVVGFIYRDAYYNGDIEPERQNIAEINIAKWRDGQTGVVELYWHEQTVSFRNLNKQEIVL